MTWLIFLIFGNGWGLAMPHFDGALLWLRDKKTDGPGFWYHWIGGLGAQIESFELRRPPAGERRILNGREYTVFSTIRHGPVCRVSWALSSGLPKNLEEAHALIRQIKKEFEGLI